MPQHIQKNSAMLLKTKTKLWKYTTAGQVSQGLKLAVANVQNVTDFRPFAFKIFYLGANFILKFLKLSLA